MTMQKFYTDLCLAIGLILFLVGCSTPLPAVPAADAAPLTLSANVSAETVHGLLDNDNVVILDVREEWEFAEGHIPGAQWLPLGELANRTDEIPTDKTVILACRSGNRSSQSYNFLKQQGFDNVHNMTGGMLGWESAGYEVEQ